MKKKTIPVEFVYQLFALIIAIIIVHAVYVSIVRPNATEVLEQQAIEAANNPDYIRERSTWVLIKDLEQEACFILMFWALAIMGYKAREILRERNLLEIDLVPIAEGCEYCRRIRESSRARWKRYPRITRACCCHGHS